jgi:hypothetical protein
MEKSFGYLNTPKVMGKRNLKHISYDEQLKSIHDIKDKQK